MSYDAQIRKLVELYGTMRAYEEVSKTCDLQGFDLMCCLRTREFTTELARYAAKRYGRDVYCKAKAMDDVLHAYGQLTLF